METGTAFRILDIDTSKDENLITGAYRAHLAENNPEDNPEGFKQLREAYETALEYARTEETEIKELTEVDSWIEQVNNLYQDLPGRYRVDEWERLFHSDIFDQIDLGAELESKFVEYLMGHCEFPYQVWQVINNAFSLTDRIEELSQDYPVNFLKYIEFYINNEGFIPYELFSYRDELDDTCEGDAYIHGYLEVKRFVDERNMSDEDMIKEIDKLASYGVYHPYEDVERTRIYINQEKYSEALEVLEKLTAKYPDDTYILLYYAVSLYWNNNKDTAEEIFNRLLESGRNYNDAHLYLGRCLMEHGQYYKAKEHIITLLDNTRENEKYMSILRQINEYLIEDMTDCMKTDRENEEYDSKSIQMEIGWCLFQNEKYEEAISFMKDYPYADDYPYEYNNLVGRLLYEAGHYSEAEPLLEKLLEVISKYTDDGTDETRKRMGRYGYISMLLANCAAEDSRTDEAVMILDRAAEWVTDKDEKINLIYQKSRIYLKNRLYEKTIDVCDTMLQMDEEYYPAYVDRQEAFYRLYRAQEVIDDYHNCVKLYPVYYKPYSFAAEVFFQYGMYSDSLEVIEQAEKNGAAISEWMLLIKSKCIRNLGYSEHSEKRFREALRILSEIQSRIYKRRKGVSLENDTMACDIENESEVFYEAGINHWELNENEAAERKFRQAVEDKSAEPYYYLTLGDFYLSVENDQDRFEKAMECYRKSYSLDKQNPNCCCKIAELYEKRGNMIEAVSYYEKAVEIAPSNYKANEKLSDYYSNLYHQGKADYEFLQKSIRLTTNAMVGDGKYYFTINRGLLYMSNLELDAALKDFEDAMAIHDDDWCVWNNIGCIYKYRAEFEKAITYFEKAIELLDEDNTTYLPHSNMADCYIALKDYENAIGIYLKAIDIQKRAGSGLASLYMTMERYDDAIRHAKASGNKYLVNKYQRNRMFANANKSSSEFKKNIRNHINNKHENYDLLSERYNEIGDLYIKYFHDYKTASAYYIKAIDKAVEFKDQMNDYFEGVMALWLSGNRAKAKKTAMKFMKKYKSFMQKPVDAYLEYPPELPERLGDLAWIYMALDETEKALDMFDKMDQCLRCKKCEYAKCFEKRLNLAKYYEAVGDIQNAVKYYREVLEISPYCTEAKIALEMLGC